MAQVTETLSSIHYPMATRAFRRERRAQVARGKRTHSALFRKQPSNRAIFVAFSGSSLRKTA